MITYLDVPYEDELLYSWLARNHFIQGGSLKQTSINFFGIEHFHQTLHYHTSLDFFVNQIQHINIGDLNNNHTLTPIYKPFVSVEKQETLLINNKVRRLKENHNDKIKLCPLCCEEEHKEKGHIYLHRNHQVPGNEICLKHKVLLQKIDYSHKEYFNLDGFDYKSLDIVYASNALESKYINFSEDINFILSGGLNDCHIKLVMEKYKQILKDKKYEKGNFLNIKKLEDDLIEYYGVEFLEELGLTIQTKSNRTWVGYFFKNQDYAKDIVKNLILIDFLFGNTKNFSNYQIQKKQYFGDGPWVCINKVCPNYNKPTITEYELYYNSNNRCFAGKFKCSCGYAYGQLTKNEKPYVLDYGNLWRARLKQLIKDHGRTKQSIADELNCDHHTIKREAIKMCLLDELNKKIDLKTIYRNDILASISKNELITISELSNNYSRQYSYLKKNDKLWFDEILDKVKEKEERNYWIKRDQELVDLISNVIDDILRNNKSTRITIKQLSKAEKCSTLIKLSKYSNKLPNTMKIIQEYCETKEQYKDRIKFYNK